ncbi:MAG: DUF1839 family protein [Pseudomonadales bacterium]|nr:DUF1839 family protein [Pseudomonadales bacterium]
MRSIVPLSPETYERHFIHGPGRAWAETNCYVDVLVELIHALGHEPAAALAFTVSVDFEVDQWTFFKFRHEDLLEMYGMEVQELNPWLSLSQHVEEQVEGGRPVLVEMDSFYLPDTRGTAYKLAHVKSTIAVNEIDVAARHMGYFHGQGYYHVDGQDFADIFQLDGLVHERMLPPYIELVRLRPVGAGSLLERSIASLEKQLRLVPETNPFETFRTRFERDFDWLMTQPIETFHIYSFANLRQYGACYELLETYLTWLKGQGETGLDDVIAAFNEISSGAKAFQFKLARAMARKKPMELEAITAMGERWQAGVDRLKQKYLG